MVLGAYVAVAAAAPVLAEGRTELARLLAVPAAGLAFVPSAEAALDALLAAWPLREGDTVAVVSTEWGPNLHAFTHRRLRVAEIATGDGGVADLVADEQPPGTSPLWRVEAVEVNVAAWIGLCSAVGEFAVAGTWCGSG